MPDKNAGLARTGAIGAIFFSAWHLAGLAAYQGFAIMGEADTSVTSYVASHYFWFNIFFQLSLLAVAAVIGAAIGFFSGLLARKFKCGAMAAFVIMALVWLSVELRLLVAAPQFFDGPFLDSKPAMKEIVFWPTSWLHPAVAEAFVWIFIAALALAPLEWLWRALKSRWMRVLGVAAAVVALFGVSSDNVRSAAPSARPNILLIVIDSLRADHISFNGYRRRVSPRIDALATEGVMFDNVIVDIPRTFPSWVSMMTARYPMTHGVRHMFPTPEQRRLVYPPLPKILAKNGYQTAVVSDFAGDIFPRIDLGFETVDAPDFTFDTLVRMRNLEMHPLLLAFLNNRIGAWLYPSIRELVYNSDPKTLTARAIRHLRRFDRNRPFMLALFYSATHLPYATPGPYYRTYTDRGYRGPHRFQKKNLLMKDFTDTPEDVQHVIDLYDGAIFSIDRQIGRMVDLLKRRGSFENTVIAITGDHGENFFENRAEIGHGNHLRGPWVVKVPLILFYPKTVRGPRRIETQTRLIDLAPTLAQFAGMAFPAVDGKSLIPLIDGGEKGHRPAYSETGLWYLDEGPFFFQAKRIHYPSLTGLARIDTEWRSEVVIKEKYQALTTVAKHRMYSDGHLKLIVMPTEEGVEYELYDLERDPEEKTDIAAANPAALESMVMSFERFMKTKRGIVGVNGYYFNRREFAGW